MSQTYKILCAIDYSRSCEPAISLASNLAASQQSVVHLLHVVEPGAAPLSMDDVQLKKFNEGLLDTYFSQKDIEHHFHSLRGKPATAIIEFAKQRHVDVIVMGTHGRTGLARVVSGSVAQSVMSNAHCPVVTIKLPAEKLTEK